MSKFKVKFEELFGDLSFVEDTHKYYLKGCDKPLFGSVSNIVHQFDPYVDFEAIKIRKAAELGITPEELQAEWNRITIEAQNLGTATHLYAEFYDGSQQPSNGHEAAAKKFLDRLPKRYVIVCKEARMYHKRIKFAGTSDLVLYDTKTNTFIIADYKTNKDLFKSYDFLTGVFSFNVANNYNRYQIQLSLYQILLEQIEGLKVSARWIVYLKENGTYDIMPTDNYTKILKTYLDEKY